MSLNIFISWQPIRIQRGTVSPGDINMEVRLPENLEGQFSRFHWTTQRQVGTPTLIIYFAGKVRNIETNSEPRIKHFRFESLTKEQKEQNQLKQPTIHNTRQTLRYLLLKATETQMMVCLGIRTA